MSKPKPTPSGRVLDGILVTGGAVAKRIASRYHRTTLHRWRTGRRAPDANAIAWLHNNTRGRVRANGWSRGATVGGR